MEPSLEETQLYRTSPAASSKSILITWTDTSGAHRARVERRTIVGSAAVNGLIVDDSTVSRLHAELELRDDGLWIRDLGSRNGTYVDGVFVQAARVRDGANITLGSVVLHSESFEDGATPDLWPGERFGSLVGVSAPMRELFSSLSRLAPLESSVFIQGETGTGKELVAQAIHEASARADQPFVVVDCAALSETLLDSELFGHAKGSFTGAASARAGAIESAEGGTVFLDEIGELPISMQPKLLRVLESRTVRRLGESTHRKVNVRFISATHRDLLTMVTAGEFREDLFFRLAVLPVTIPALRDRPDDIARLVTHFLPPGALPVSPEVLGEIAKRPWRGNVRELRNFVERVLALGATRALAMTPDALVRSPDSKPPVTTPPEDAFPAVSFRQEFKSFREQWVDQGERAYVTRLLARHERNVASAAEEAGVDRTYLYRLIRKHAL